MIEKHLEQLKMLKTISLSEQEKGILRAQVARGIELKRNTSKPSIFYTGLQHGLRISLSTFLFIVFVGGSVSVVADNSLPGDPLYSFKINVNEEVKGNLMKTPEDKLAWQKTRIDNRVGEIKTLAASKTLTKAKQETAQKALNTHIETLSVELSKTETNEALKLTADLEQSLKTQKEELEKYDQEEGAVNAIKVVDETLLKVSEEEKQIVSKEIDNISKDIAGLTEQEEVTDPLLEEKPSQEIQKAKSQQ